MIENVWNRIVQLEGEIFKQMRGKEFSYEVKGNSLLLSTTNRALNKKTIEEALSFVPLENTSPVQHLQAPSYVYAILMDDRVKKSEW